MTLTLNEPAAEVLAGLLADVLVGPESASLTVALTRAPSCPLKKTGDGCTQATDGSVRSTLILRDARLVPRARLIAKQVNDLPDVSLLIVTGSHPWV